MKYAVIKTGGKQYKVSEGDIIEVDRLNKEIGKIFFDDVLLYVDEKTVNIGKPTLSEKVEGMLLENIKGDKIRVSKFKSKVRYRRTSGFRASLSKVKIEKIVSPASKKQAKTSKKK